MTKTRTGSTTDGEEGSTDFIESTGKGQTSNGDTSWVPTWLPKRFPKGFIKCSSLCGLCAAAEVAEVRWKQTKLPKKPQISGELSGLLNAESN